MMNNQTFNSKIFIFSFCLLFGFPLIGKNILIPMDENNQKNHLKSYGIAYWIIQNEVKVNWLLNYRGGSFMCEFLEDIEKECIYRGVSYEIISSEDVNSILNNIAQPQNNYDIIELEKAPKIAVYSPSK